MGIFAALAAVAAVAGRNDVAEMMLAAVADWYDVLYLQVSLASAVGTAVVKAGPVPPEVRCTEMHRLATSLCDLASFGLGAVVQAMLWIGHERPSRLKSCPLSKVGLVVIRMRTPMLALLIAH